MNRKYLFVVTILIIGTVSKIVHADYDDYVEMSICESRCELKNRMNPFAQSCDNCCRYHGFKKGKCGRFGWAKCLCKRMGPIRAILNNILTG